MTIDYAVNIMAVYRRALFCERVKGAAWYREAHEIAVELSPDNVWRGAGVIAAFSPRQPWPLNVRNARRAFATGEATGHTRVMCRIAQRILDGEDALEVLKGDKTRNFTMAIATAGKSNVATIDRHAHDIAMGSHEFTDDTRNIGKAIYADMATAYREVAEYVGESVNTIQAVTWLTWRREKGVADAWRNGT